MKAVLVASLLCLPTTVCFSAAPQQLSPQKSSALPAHLTTRIEWRKMPQPNYNNDDLQGQNRAAIIRVYADEQGKITKTSVQESTGIKKLDQILVNAVEASTVKPHQTEDTTLPIIGYQVFNLNLKDEDTTCSYSFESKQWLKQKQQHKTRFQYVQQPQLNLAETDLAQRSRNVKFKFKRNKDNQVSRVKITESSGLSNLDQRVIDAVLHTEIQTARKASTLWLYKPTHFKDEIRFKLGVCS